MFTISLDSGASLFDGPFFFLGPRTCDHADMFDVEEAVKAVGRDRAAPLERRVIIN
jgi:hypothetical protein